MRFDRLLIATAAALAAFPALPARAQEPVPPSVSSALAEITGKPMYKHSIWGYRVVDQATGAVVLEHNPDQLFVTGSTLKLYSSAAALDAIGPNHRFRTPVHRRGAVSRGTLRGDLVLVASGDFSFGLRDRPNGTLAYNDTPDVDHNYADTGLPGPTLLKRSDPLDALDALARQVRASGIRRVTGDVVIDDRLFETFRGWPDGVIAPIWVNENVIDITTRPGRVGQTARVDWRPRSAAYRVVSQVRTVAGRGTPLTVDSPRPGVLRVRGRISRDSGPLLSIWHVRDPAAFARTTFIEALRRAGVAVDAPTTGRNPSGRLPRARTYPRDTRVAQRVSPPLSEYVKVILKVSYNRGSDEMVCLVAVARGSRDCRDGLKPELTAIGRLGVSPRTTILYDGAGASDLGRSTLVDFTTMLRHATARPWGAALRDGLPILGVDGNFAANQRGTPAAGHVFVKSGTRAHEAPTDQALMTALTQAGYIDARSGRKLVYALFLRDLPLSGNLEEFFAADEDQGRLAAALQQGY